jgi:cytochrome b6-f complex iron-sulfur subunit/menaquinol-cytochrome c reductase iron-sulfur subunit
MVLGGGALYAGGLAVPAYRFMSTEGSGPSGERWFRLAKLSSLAEGKPTRVRIVGEHKDAFTVARGQILGSVWLTRKGDEVRALSAICPHLGCAIDMGKSDKFSCPCHTSSFTLEGVPEEGPSPRPMDELTARVTDGHVEVDFRNFKLGVKEKVEA